MSRLATFNLPPATLRPARSRRVPALLPFGFALALGLAGCGGEAALVRTVSVTGTLAAEDQVAMGFKVAGRIETINVDLGSRVSPGQTIARLASVDFQLRMQQSEAALQQARA